VITVEEKLDIFYKLILGEERDRSEEILEKIQMKNEELIREKKEEALKKKEEIVSKKKKNGRIEKE
jgi:vacuolar-type H+-ATPase subunit H